jgi:UPF0716 protein FxsA
MHPAHILVFLLLALPVLELYILIRAGVLLGVTPTVALCVLSAATGLALLRHQGLQNVNNLRMKILQGESPTLILIEGAVLFAGGVLLLLPGFVTDIIGLLCLIPGLRRTCARHLEQRILRWTQTRGSGVNVIIEGEFRREDREFRPPLDHRED